MVVSVGWILCLIVLALVGFNSCVAACFAVIVVLVMV